MGGFFEKLNKPKSLLVVLVLTLIVGSLFLYRYQSMMSPDIFEIPVLEDPAPHRPRRPPLSPPPSDKIGRRGSRVPRTPEVKPSAPKTKARLFLLGLLGGLQHLRLSRPTLFIFPFCCIVPI
jgi:hypothetical protein